MILAIIQARINSSRFPNKINEQIFGRRVIDWVVKAARDSKIADQVFVAYAENFPELEEDDVLGRFKKVIARVKPRVVVRLTADCPLLKGEVIDDAIREFSKDAVKNGYYCNRNTRKDGYDVQVFYPRILEDPVYAHREHVINPIHVPNYNEHFLSVDTPEDLKNVSAVMAAELGFIHGWFDIFNGKLLNR